jgi:hypothetical protein
LAIDGVEVEFTDEVTYAALDVVTDGSYGFGVEAGGVVEVVP